jgi:hypothetical protein
MVAHSGTNAPGVNGYDVTIGKNADGSGQVIPNVAISASETLFRVIDKKDLDFWPSKANKYTQKVS